MNYIREKRMDSKIKMYKVKKRMKMYILQTKLKKPKNFMKFVKNKLKDLMSK